MVGIVIPIGEIQCMYLTKAQRLFDGVQENGNELVNRFALLGLVPHPVGFDGTIAPRDNDALCHREFGVY
jgi:hypothetical protein